MLFQKVAYWISCCVIAFLFQSATPALLYSQELSAQDVLPKQGALDGVRHRVIISTDIGGTDPDDYQSMVHLLVYADMFDLEGLISSPYGPGRKQHILDVINCYEQDFPNLSSWSQRYPKPDELRAITKQGETELASYSGVGKPTEGSDWIIECARRDDDRPLYVLVWGALEDVAQALHDAPDILPKLRVYYIGGPNKKWGPHAYQYLLEHHPTLWMIENNATYRGWFVGGNQNGDFGNKAFVSKHIAGHGALGDFFVAQKDDIKMGDTPSLTWLMKGNPAQPQAPSWGGQFVRAWKRPIMRFNGLTTSAEKLEVFGILEMRFSIQEQAENPSVELLAENQVIQGDLLGDGTIRIRYCPKAVGTYPFKLRSNMSEWNHKVGGITVVSPSPDTAAIVDESLTNWWTDSLLPELQEGPHSGAKSVSRWREDYLQDFADRMMRCVTAKPESP